MGYTKVHYFVLNLYFGRKFVKINRLGLFAVVLSTSLMLASCGDNVFKGYGEKTSQGTSVSALSNELDFANTPTAFESIATRASAQLEKDSLTDTERQSYLVIQGTAILGAHDITILNVVDVLADLEDDSDVYEALRVLLGSISTTNLQLAADAINEANLLGGGLQPVSLLSEGASVFSSAEVPTLNNNKQLLRGVANLTVTVKMIIRVFSMDNSSVELTDSVDSYVDAVSYLFGGSRTVKYYADNAIDAFTLAGGLTESELQTAQSVKDKMTALQALYVQINLADGVYESWPVGSNTESDTRETNIQALLTQIIF
jgi:hypothetical protein